MAPDLNTEIEHVKDAVYKLYFLHERVCEVDALNGQVDELLSVIFESCW